MRPVHWKIFFVCFWVFICGMLLWQFISYNQGIDKQTMETPAPKQYFFYNTNTAPVSPAFPVVQGPMVKQITFAIDDKKPDPLHFTCNVTAKNVGKTKAVNVQVLVRPYRGIQTAGGEVNLPGQTETYLNDNDPLAQVSEWLSFPDLAPGETSTQSVVFYRKPEVEPGENPNPEITFDAEKPKP